MIIASLAEWKILEIPDGSYCICEAMDDLNHRILQLVQAKNASAHLNCPSLRQFSETLVLHLCSRYIMF